MWLDGPSAQEGRVGGPARELFLEMNERALRAEDPGDQAEIPPAWPRLGEIAVPTLMLLGRLDAEEIQVDRRAGRALIPGARLRLPRRRRARPAPRGRPGDARRDRRVRRRVRLTRPLAQAIHIAHSSAPTMRHGRRLIGLAAAGLTLACASPAFAGTAYVSAERCTTRRRRSRSPDSLLITIAGGIANIGDGTLGIVAGTGCAQESRYARCLNVDDAVIELGSGAARSTSSPGRPRRSRSSAARATTASSSAAGRSTSRAGRAGT